MLHRYGAQHLQLISAIYNSINQNASALLEILPSGRTPISNLQAHLQIFPTRQFIYHLTDKLFVSCPVHPHSPIRNTGNYTVDDLHRQYTKYKHKRIKHTALNDVYPDVAMFFSSSVMIFFTALSINPYPANVENRVSS
jgi:hypothetical protein